MSHQTQQPAGVSQAGPRPPLSTKNPITGEELPKGYTAVFACNMMKYTDGAGHRHEIYMPPRTYERAIDYCKTENWDALAKFPPWQNQKRTAEDVILVKIDEGDDVEDDAANGKGGDN